MVDNWDIGTDMCISEDVDQFQTRYTQELRNKDR